MNDTRRDIRARTLMESALASEEQRCPFLPTTTMNKSLSSCIMKQPCEAGSQSLTITRDDPERDRVPGFLDQVDNVRV